MSAMKDYRIATCEAIENTMCDALDMEKCERTWEISEEILEAIGAVEAEFLGN